jgi:translation initiation factor IF-1
METLPSALYKVRLDEGSLVMAHIADRMDRNFVRLLVGDQGAVGTLADRLSGGDG